MSKDPRLAEGFSLPPLVAYKRPPNIKQKLIRAKVPAPITRPKRESKGIKKCLKCSACTFIKEATQSSFKADIYIAVNCQTTNCIYLLGCKKCAQQYYRGNRQNFKGRALFSLGEWGDSPQELFKSHRKY